MQAATKARAGRATRPIDRATARTRSRGSSIGQVEAAEVVPDDGQHQVRRRRASTTGTCASRRWPGSRPRAAAPWCPAATAPGRRSIALELGDGAHVPVGGQPAEQPLQPHRALDVAQRVAAERHERVVGPTRRGPAPWRRRRRPTAAVGCRGGRRRRRRPARGSRPCPPAVRGTARGVDVRRHRWQPCQGDDRPRTSSAAAPGAHDDEPVVVAGRHGVDRRRRRGSRSTASRSMRNPNGFTKRDRRPTISNTPAARRSGRGRRSPARRACAPRRGRRRSWRSRASRSGRGRQLADVGGLAVDRPQLEVAAGDRPGRSPAGASTPAPAAGTPCAPSPRSGRTSRRGRRPTPRVRSTHARTRSGAIRPPAWVTKRSVGTCERVGPGPLEQLEGVRHAGDVRDAAARIAVAKHGSTTDAVVSTTPAPATRWRVQHRQAVAVVQRQRRDGPVVGPRPRYSAIAGVADHVGVGEADELRRAGRARRAEQQGEVGVEVTSATRWHSMVTPPSAAWIVASARHGRSQRVRVLTGEQRHVTIAEQREVGRDELDVVRRLDRDERPWRSSIPPAALGDPLGQLAIVTRDHPRRGRWPRPSRGDQPVGDPVRSHDGHGPLSVREPLTVEASQTDSHGRKPIRNRRRLEEKARQPATQPVRCQTHEPAVVPTQAPAAG